MKTVFVSLSVLLLAGCEKVMVVKRGVDTVFAAGVSVYCKLQEPARRLNRQRIAAKIAPHRIEIHCFTDSRMGG